MQLFDTHFHLDLAKNPLETAMAIERMKVYTFAVTNLPSLFETTQSLTEGLKYIRPALGFHPELAAKYSGHIQQFMELLPQTRYVGEVGLDNEKKTVQDFSIQKQVFERILSLCASMGNKVLTIHSRAAEKVVLEMVGDQFPGRVILHWYSGSLANLEVALRNGYYFSVNYAMTQSKKGRQLIAMIPIDRLLLETDGPFVKIRNELCSPVHTYEILAEIGRIMRKEDINELGNMLFKNFKKLIS